MSLLRILLLLWLLTAWLPHLHAAHPFLPDSGKATFSGEFRNEGEKLTPEISWSIVAEGAWGKAVEVRFSTDRIPAVQWVVRPDGSIFQADFGTNRSAVISWTEESIRPVLGEMLLPPLEIEEEHVDFQSGSIESSAARMNLLDTPERVQFSQDSTTTSITLDPTRQFARYSHKQENGKFLTYVLQKGLGLVYTASGENAAQPDWKLSRLFPPAGKLTQKPDIGTLFALLPKEAMPVMGAMPLLQEPEHRAKVISSKTREELEERATALNTRDWLILRDAGYLKACSNGDGEGQWLEAAVWNREDGSRLLGLNLVNWTAGPETTVDLRFYEWKDGRFRLATFSDLALPQPEDFVEDPTSATNAGHIVGTWRLPEQGTTITVRPQGEQELMIEENPEIPENYSFEFLWNGNVFSRVRLPRQLTTEGHEPGEWIFQSLHKPVALFLRRKGSQLDGELREKSSRASLFIEITPNGQEMPVTLGKAQKGKASFAELRETPFENWTLQLETEETEEPLEFQSVPQSIDSGDLPRFHIIEKTVQVKAAKISAQTVLFDLPKTNPASWKSLNAQLEKAAELELETGKKALLAAETITEDMEVTIQQRLLAVDEDRIDICMEVLTHADGSEGSHELVSLNFNTNTAQRVPLAAFFKNQTEWQTKLIEMLHQRLEAEGTLEAGHTSPELLQHASWSFTPGEGLTITFPMRALGPSSDKTSVTLTSAELESLKAP